MISPIFRSRSLCSLVVLSSLTGVAGAAAAQDRTDKPDPPEHHSRRYKPLPAAVKITVTVEKAANGKPISNAGVIFRATKSGKNEGSLEIKSDPDGHAMIDVIEVGSHVKVQVIADGFSTAAAEFDVPDEVKDITIKMEKPRAQISTYDDGTDRPSARPPGVQEPRPIAKKPAVKSMPSAAPSPLTPPPVATPATPETAPPSGAPAAGGAPASSKDVSGAGTPSAGATSTAPSTVTPGAATVGAPK